MNGSWSLAEFAAIELLQVGADLARDADVLHVAPFDRGGDPLVDVGHHEGSPRAPACSPRTSSHFSSSTFKEHWGCGCGSAGMLCQFHLQRLHGRGISRKTGGLGTFRSMVGHMQPNLSSK